MKSLTKSTNPFPQVFAFFFLLLMAPAAFAQRSPEILQGAEAKRIAPQSEMVRMNLLTQTPNFIKFEEAAAPSFQSLGSLVEKTFQVNKDHELKLLRSERDQIGYQHYRYQQTYKGLPVEGSVFLAHVKDGKIMSMNGEFANKIKVSTQAVLSEQAGLAKALASIHAKKYMWELLAEQPELRQHDAYKEFAEKPKGQLVILDKNLGTERASDYRLAWKFDIYAFQPHKRVDIFIDANSGEVVQQHNKIHEDTVGDEPATAETTYSGNRTMTTDNTGNGATPYRLYEASRKISTKNFTGNAEYTDNDNAWTAAEMSTKKYAMDAHWGTEKTFDYYLNTFGRNSYDGNGALLQSFLNNNALGAINAFWNGSSMNYGTGSGGVTPLTCLDVVGHELTHAVTEYSANLTYSNQSGALNESFSDIFGTLIEFYAKPPNGAGNWTLGEDANIIIRSMSNPNAYDQPDTYLGNFWATGGDDNGGVHTNSGVQNFWFYLLTNGGTGTNDIGSNYNVTGIGMDDAAAIAYRTLTVYLTPSSNYDAARFYSIIAAKDLFGGCPVSQEVISTTNAWFAVGVGAAYVPEALTMDFTSIGGTLFCSTPQSISFQALQSTGIANPATIAWNFGDGGTGTGLNPSHTYTTTGSFTVTMSASDCSGTPIVPVVKTNYIVIDNSVPCVQSMPTSGSHVETTCTGTLYDSGGTGNYQNNINSTFTLHSGNGTNVTLVFSSFDFELNFDYLKIYDGPTTASPLIGSYTGTTLPNGGKVKSTGSSITIQQLTDVGLVRPGFQLTWVSEPDGDGVAGASCGGTDCDDNDPNVWTNCNTCVDDDSDGYFAGCDAYVTVLGPDCDDFNDDINPGEAEICNNVDDNCAGGIDEGITQNYYFDGDGDGYGAGMALLTCNPPANYILQDGDCDDANDAINPGEAEICNNVDDNCAGGIDEGITQNYYFDGDNDGYGAGAAVLTCSPGPGYVLQNGDCNDADADVNPGATEVCNGVDDNCDGITDSPSNATFISSNVPITIPSTNTTPPLNFTSTLTISGIAGNVIGLKVKDLLIHHTWIGDLKVMLTSPGNITAVLFDRPGRTTSGAGCINNHILASFDDAAALTAAIFEGTCNSSTLPTPPPYAINGIYQSVNPLSVFNGTSPNGTWTLTVQDYANADGGSLEGWGLEITTPANLVTYFVDADGDTYGDPNNTVMLNCTPTVGYVLNNTDCNDNDPDIHPNATEICDGVDNNCVGGIDEGNTCCPTGNVLYVNDDATGLNNGNSWTNAFTSLQSALASTCPGITEIWVAAGTYKPTTGSDRNLSFVLKNNLAIYGGFPDSGNPGFSNRNWELNATILSGDIGAAGNGDNSYNVVKGTGTQSTAILDGFTITGGNANAPAASGNYSTASRNGGGMFNSGASSPTVRNCYFTGNAASVKGGGMFNSNNNCAPTVTNCAFTNNTAGYGGGGMANWETRSGAFPVITNCTFYGNTGSQGGGMLVDSARAHVTNCILWGNSSGIAIETTNGGFDLTLTTSILQGGCPSNTTCTSVLNVDPLYVNAPNGNVHIQACSPAIDAGTATSAPVTDYDNQARPNGAGFDIGFDEYSGPACCTFTLPANGVATVACPAQATQPTPPAITSSCNQPVVPTGPVISSTPACEGTKTYTWTYTLNNVSQNWVFTYTIEREDFSINTPNGSATVACPSMAVQPTRPMVADNCGQLIAATGPVITNTPNPLTCEGTRIYTWTYTDCEGNSHDWTFTYTIERNDFTVPANGTATVSCPAAITTPVPPTVISNCGETIVPTGPVVSTTPVCEGTKTYTWTYTDCEGNTHPWVFTYTIERNDFVVPANGAATVSCPSAITTPVPPTVLSDCGETIVPTGPSITATPACEGTKTYTWTYTDCEGNAHDWSFTYTIERIDFTVPANGAATVSCPAAIITPTPPTVLSDCGETITPTGPVVSTTPACEGTKTYTWTYTDCEGNTHPWVFTYTIERNDFQVPANGAVTVACPAQATQPVPPTVLSDCGETIAPTGPVISATPACEGTKTYTWTYTDCEGNTHPWIFTYIIERNDFTVPANGSATVACVALATPPTPPTVLSNCGETVPPIGPIITDAPNPLTCAGTRIYIYTYTDCEGNSHAWSFTYTIVPVPFTVPANGAATVACPASATQPTPPVVLDACGNPTTPTGPVIVNNPNPVTCEGTRTYTWEYTDCAGNMTPWSFVYTIERNDFAVPANGSATVSCPSAITTPTPPTVQSNCGETLTPTGPVISATPVCEGTKTYTWTYTDCEGNTHPWVFTYTVIRNDFAVPANGAATVSCPSLATQPTPPTVQSNCGETITPTGPVIGATPACEGTKTYTWTYTDCAGHSHNWTFTYTIEREPFFVPANGGANVACTDQTDVQPTPPTVTSNCGEILIPTVSSSAKNGCEGDRNWYFTYTDCEGNTATWIFAYHVENLDFTVPPSETVTVECPLNIEQPTPPVVYDNCGKLLTPTGPVINEIPGTAGCEAGRSFTWTYKDCEGNTHAWSSTFLFDYTGDFFTYPDGVAYVGCLEQAQHAAPPTIYDNCGREIVPSGPIVTEEISEVGCSGIRTFTYVYTDCGGNSHPWSFTYIADDNEPPVGTCPTGSGSADNPGVDVTNLSCMEEVPCPTNYDFTQKIQQLLAAGHFYDQCSGNDLVVTLDSWSAMWECSDPDGNGQFTFGRTFYFSIADQCGNEFPDLCSVTYSGVCQPITIFPTTAWGQGEENGGMNLATIQHLLDAYGPLKIGGGIRSLTLTQASCVADLLPGEGGAGILANCNQMNCTGCNPVGPQGIKNLLAADAIAVELSLRQSVDLNGASMTGILSQGLGCIQLPPSLVTCSGGICQLHLFGGNGVEHLYPYTIGGLLDMVDYFLGGNLGASDTQAGAYATQLDKALQNLMAAYSGTGQTHLGCDPGAGVIGLDGANKNLANGNGVSKAKDTDELDLELSPNPASSKVNVRINGFGGSDVRLTVLDRLGRLILVQTIDTETETLQLDFSRKNLAAGEYYVRVVSRSGTLTKKLMLVN